MPGFTDFFTGSAVVPSDLSYALFTLTAAAPSLTLSWPISAVEGEATAARINDVNATATLGVIYLPPATEVSTGQDLIINNVGTEDFDVYDNTGQNRVVRVAVGSLIWIYLIDNTTQGGTWRVAPFGGAATAVTQVAATANTSGLTVTGSPIISSGTLDFALSPNLEAVSDFNTPGFVVLQDTTPTLTARTLSAGNNIVITNGDAIQGDPVISVAPNVNVTSLTATSLISPQVVKAWGSIEPDGTLTSTGYNAATSSLRESDNLYTVTLLSEMPSANYLVLLYPNITQSVASFLLTPFTSTEFSYYIYNSQGVALGCQTSFVVLSN